MRESGDIGVHVPDSIADAVLELAVLLPG
jgi:hypothetical protein